MSAQELAIVRIRLNVLSATADALTAHRPFSTLHHTH